MKAYITQARLNGSLWLVLSTVFLVLCMSNSFAQVLVQLGTPTTSSTSPLVNAYVPGYANDRKQFIVTAAELIAAGAPVTGGGITHIGFYGINGSGSCNFNFTVSVKHTSLSSLSGTPLTSSSNWETGFTTIFSGSVNNASGVSGWRDRGGAGSFIWDGVSNLIVQTCNNTGGCNSGANLTSVCKSYYTASGFSNSTRRSYSPGSGTACGFVPSSAGSYSYRSDRPVMRFSIFSPNAGQDTTIYLGESVQLGSASLPGYTYSWTPTTGLSDPDIANPVASPTGTTTYILTVEDAFSQIYTDTVTITVIPTMRTDATAEHSITDSIPLTPANVFDTIFDSYGNRYSLNSLMVNDTNSFRTTCLAGYFNVIFEPNCGMNPTGSQVEQDRAAVVCQVLSDISDLIVSPLTNSEETVNIWVRDISQIVSNPATSNVLGAASSFYVLPAGAPAIGGIADNQIWRTIVSGTDSYTNVASPLISSNTNPGTPANYFHGMMTFNFNNSIINWNTDMSITTTTFFDLYSVVLHEITHALGFASLIDASGNSKFGPNFNYYSRYDMFLEDQNGTNLIGGNVSGCSLYDFGFNTSLSSGILAPNPFSAPCVTDQTTCGDAIIYSGSIAAPVYTPNCFEAPSTLSHFEDQCFPTGSPAGNNVYFVMSNANGTGAIKRFLQDEEHAVLCDLGYNVNDTYGDEIEVALSFKEYDNSCPGLQVAGINDGIAAGVYEYTGVAGTPIGITGILSNDFNADGFECLEVVLGVGTPSAASGTTSTTLTYTSATPGVNVLRYVPLNSTNGNRGNITYIYVYITDPNCVASPCDFINSGNFESASICGPFDATTLSCWDQLSGSPDVFVRDCSSQYAILFSTGVATYNSLPPSDSYNGTPNDNFIGIRTYQGTSFYQSEGVSTLLSSPLIPTEQYVLSFWAKVNNNLQGPTSNIPAPVNFASYPNPIPPVWITQDFFTLVPTAALLVPTTVVPNDNTWHYYTIPFNFSESINHNCLAIYYGEVGIDVQAYVFIDDVSIQLQSEAVILDLPDTEFCAGQNQEISDLSQHLTPPVQGGIFTGPGVAETDGIFSFDPGTAGVGSHLITYTYTDGNDCTRAVYDIINVLSCTCTDGENITNTTWSNSFTLTTSTIHSLNADVTVTGDNLTLTDVGINIAPNVTITVANGASLTLDHSHLYACYDMWQGIVVEPGGELTIINNSMIEDAVVAVDIQNHLVTTPVLTVNEAVFNRNRIAIAIQDYQQSAAPYPFEIQNSVFTSRDIPFTTTTWPMVSDLTALVDPGSLGEHYDVGGYDPIELKPPFATIPGYAGIALIDVGVQGTAFEVVIDGDDGTTTFNLFDELMYGIHATNSNVTIRNSAFQFMGIDGTLGGGTGVHAECNTIGIDEFRITVEGENHFYDCPTGIEVLGYNEIFISNTDMRSTQMPVSSIPDEGELGIMVETPFLAQMDITGNTITNIRNGIVFLANVDINAGQLIGPVTISTNIIQATLDGNDGEPTGEYVLNGIIADNIMPSAGIGSSIDDNPIVIAENKLYQVHNGIHAQNWTYYLFTPTFGWHNRLHDLENYISLRQVAYPTSANQQQYGIMHVLNFSGRMENNTVQGFGNTFEEWYGVFAADINPGTAYDPTVRCNTTANTGRGIYFNLPDNQVIFNDNTMVDNAQGFVLDNASIGEQGNNTYASGNKWFNFDPGNFHTYTMDNADPINSLLWIDPADIEQVPTLNGDDASPLVLPYSYTNGLSDVSTNSNNTVCNAPSGLMLNDGPHAMQQKSGNAFTDLLVKLVTDSLGYGRFPQEQYIQAQHRAYRLMDMQPGWAGDAPEALLTFYTNAQQGNIGKLAAVAKGSGTGNFMDAYALLGSMQVGNSIEENQMAYHRAYIHAKSGTFTANDSLELDRLVHGCTVRDGEVVHHARVLHRLLYRDLKTYFDACPGDRAEKLENAYEQDGTELTLYPNPSTGEVWFKIENNTARPTSVEVYAMDGTLIHSEIPQGDRIGLHFSNGAYFVILRTEKESYRGRVVIIK